MMVIALIFSMNSSFAAITPRICNVSDDTLSKYKLIDTASKEKDPSVRIPDLSQLLYSDMSCKRDGQKCNVSPAFLIKRMFNGDKKRIETVKFIPHSSKKGEPFTGLFPGKCKIKRFSR